MITLSNRLLTTEKYMELTGLGFSGKASMRSMYCQTVSFQNLSEKSMQLLLSRGWSPPVELHNLCDDDYPTDYWVFQGELLCPIYSCENLPNLSLAPIFFDEFRDECLDHWMDVQ